MFQERCHESTISKPSLNSKCGEIFVTPGWNKWTYTCTFCQLTTSDIGVFVCHIRLEHSYFENKTHESSPQQQQHSNVQHDSNDSNCLSIHDTTIEEDEMLHPIEMLSHDTLMTEEAQDFYDKHQNSLQTSSKKKKLPTETMFPDNSEKVTKIFNIETLVVPNYDAGEGGGEGVSDDKRKKADKRSKNSTAELNTEAINDKILLNTFKIVKKVSNSKSKLWEVYGEIVDNKGKIIPGYVGCWKCFKAYKFTEGSTSNLWKHACVRGSKYIRPNNKRLSLQT